MKSYMLNCPFKKTFLTLVALHIGDCKLLFFVCCCFGIRCNVKSAILIFLKWQVIENPLQLYYGPRTPVSRVKGFLNVCLSWVVCRCIHMILYCIVTRQHHTSSGPLRVQLNSASKRTQAVFVLSPASALALSLVFTLVWRKAIQHLYIPLPYLQPWPETFPPLSQLEVLTGKEGRMNVKKELIVSVTLALCRRKSQSSARRSCRRSHVSCEACKGQIYLRKV